MAYGHLNDIMKMAPKYAQGLVLTLQLRHAERVNSKSDYHLGYRQALLDVYDLAQEESRTGKDIN